MALKKILRDKFMGGFKVKQESYPFKAQCSRGNKLNNIIIKGNTEESFYNSNLFFEDGYTSTVYAHNPTYFQFNTEWISINTEENIFALTSLKKGDLITLSFHIEVSDTTKWINAVTGRVCWIRTDGKWFYALGGGGALSEGETGKDIQTTFILPYDMDNFRSFYIYGATGHATTTVTNLRLQKTHLTLPKDRFSYADINHPIKLNSCGEYGAFSSGVLLGDTYLNTANGPLVLDRIDTSINVNGDYRIPIVLRGRNLFPINYLNEKISKNLVINNCLYFSSFVNCTYSRKENLYTITPINTEASAYVRFSDIIKLEKGKTITFSFDLNRNGENAIGFRLAKVSDGDQIVVLNPSTNIETEITRYTFTYTPTETADAYMYLSLSKATNGNQSVQCVFGNVQVEYGDTATDYSISNGLKYNGKLITPSVFKKITGLKEGDYISVSYNCQGYENDSFSSTTNGKMFFDTKTQYMLDTNFEKQIILLDKQNTVGKKRIQQKSKLPDMLNDKELGALCFQGIEGKNFNYKNIQIEVLNEYETPTHGFEKYREPKVLGELKIKEPLRGIKKNKLYHNVETFDYIDFNKKKLYRKLKEVELNGNSGWVELFYSDTKKSGCYYFKCPVSEAIKPNGAICCNMSRRGGDYAFDGDKITDLITTYYCTNDENCIYFQVEKSKVDPDKGSSGLDKFKEILNKQPMVVIYELAIIKEEDVKVFDIKLPRGGSTIMTDTTISPYSIEGNYISSDKI